MILNTGTVTNRSQLSYVVEVSIEPRNHTCPIYRNCVIIKRNFYYIYAPNNTLKTKKKNSMQVSKCDVIYKYVLLYLHGTCQALVA